MQKEHSLCYNKVKCGKSKITGTERIDFFLIYGFWMENFVEKGLKKGKVNVGRKPVCSPCNYQIKIIKTSQILQVS